MLTCTGRSSCPGGDVCCATSAGIGQVSTSCAATCSGPNSTALCITSADCAGGFTCRSLGNGLGICTPTLFDAGGGG